MTNNNDNNPPHGASQMTEIPRKWPPKRRPWVLPLIIVVILVVGGPYGFRWWLDYMSSEGTDDATLQGNLISVAARVNGTVTNVAVVDNQGVKTGDLLVELDQRDFQAAVKQAEAGLELALRNADAAQAGVDLSASQTGAQTTTAEGGLSLASTSVEVAQAAVDAAEIAVASAHTRLDQAQVQLEQASQDYDRAKTLEAEGVVPKQQLDHAEAAFKVAQAAVESAKNDVSIAQSRLDQARLSVEIARSQRRQSEGIVQGAESGTIQTDVRQKQYEAALAQVDVARAALEAAQLQLSYTTINAPTDGRVGKVSVDVGQRISPGQPLIPLVQDGIWIVANFKETQMDRIRIGQTVTVKVDAFPGKVFQAHVESMSPGSGATFALLPPDNATGNFTKVIQRIPVKIVFDQSALQGYEDLLTPGMSVIVRVKVK
jgi:membrane fusion protein (multidrug efflux system)